MDVCGVKENGLLMSKCLVLKKRMNEVNRISDERL